MIMPENTLNDTTLNITYSVTLEEDGDDVVLPLPDDVLDQLDWQEGDMLEWIVNEKDNTVMIRKVSPEQLAVEALEQLHDDNDAGMKELAKS